MLEKVSPRGVVIAEESLTMPMQAMASIDGGKAKVMKFAVGKNEGDEVDAENE